MTKFRLYPSFSMCCRKMRTQSEWKVQMVGRVSELDAESDELREAFGTSFLTRSCISRAALFVNVTPSMCPGAIPRSIRCAIRNVITLVFPVPAPARISTGPFRVSTAIRCCGFNELTFNIARAEGAHFEFDSQVRNRQVGKFLIMN